MNKDKLPAIFATEFAKPVVEVASNVDIRDMFGLPATVRFQDCGSTSEYQQKVDEVFAGFTSWLDRELEGSQRDQLALLEELRFAVDEYLRAFTWNLEKETGLNLLQNKRVDLGDLPPEDHMFVAAVVSGFLEIQQRALERIVRYLDLRMRLLRAEKNAGEQNQTSTLINTIAGLVKNMESGGKTAGSEKSPQTKIVWNGSAQEFVAHFAPMIQSRQIYLEAKHKLDTDPIAALLHQLFFIQKARGDGEISAGTLRTYFKEYNAGKY